jgi:hypothetical protein
MFQAKKMKLKKKLILHFIFMMKFLQFIRLCFLLQFIYFSIQLLIINTFKLAVRYLLLMFIDFNEDFMALYI